MHSLRAPGTKKMPLLLWDLDHAMGLMSIIPMHNVAIKWLLPNTATCWPVLRNGASKGTKM